MTGKRTNWAGNVTFGAERFHRPASVPELQHLVARSGRVPALIAGISNTLHIRPVFRMQGAETGRVALAPRRARHLVPLDRLGPPGGRRRLRAPGSA